MLQLLTAPYVRVPLLLGFLAEVRARLCVVALFSRACLIGGADDEPSGALSIAAEESLRRRPCANSAPAWRSYRVVD